MSELKRYPKIVRWSEEDEGWIAIAPDLPGCSAFGETDSDALGELEFAISAWIEAAEEAGNAIPEPSGFDGEDYSGKFVLRLQRSLHATLSRNARMEGVSLNQYVVNLLVAAVAFRTVEAAAKAAASIVGDTVLRFRSIDVSGWRKPDARAGRSSEYAYVSPQNWSPLSQVEQIQTFEVLPDRAANVIER